MMTNQLKTITQIIEYWLSANSDLSSQKIIELSEFVLSLDKPVEFELKDGTVIKTGDRSDHDVEIKPLTDLEKFIVGDKWTDEQMKAHDNSLTINEKGDTIKKTLKSPLLRRKDLEKDCKHEFIKMDNGAAMSLDDQATGERCELCGKWRNVKTLRGDVEIRPNIDITSKSSLKPLSAKGMKGGDPVIVGEQHPVFDYESSNPMDMIINEWQRDREILNSLTLDKLKFDPLDTTEAPKKLSLFELAKEVYKSAVGKNV